MRSRGVPTTRAALALLVLSAFALTGVPAGAQDGTFDFASGGLRRESRF